MSQSLQRQGPETVHPELGLPELREVGSTVGTQLHEQQGSGQQSVGPRNDTWDGEGIAEEDRPVLR